LALTDFDQAVALAPDDPVVRLGRLMLYRTMGNTKKALVDLKHCLQIDPGLASRDNIRALQTELENLTRQKETTI